MPTHADIVPPQVAGETSAFDARTCSNERGLIHEVDPVIATPGERDGEIEFACRGWLARSTHCGDGSRSRLWPWPCLRELAPAAASGGARRARRASPRAGCRAHSKFQRLARRRVAPSAIVDGKLRGGPRAARAVECAGRARPLDRPAAHGSHARGGRKVRGAQAGQGDDQGRRPERTGHRSLGARRLREAKGPRKAADAGRRKARGEDYGEGHGARTRTTTAAPSRQTSSSRATHDLAVAEAPARRARDETR